MSKRIAYIDINLKGDLTKKDVINFINENLIDIKIISAKDNFARIEWELSEEGVHGIEETMHYVLEGEKLGVYDYLLS